MPPAGSLSAALGRTPFAAFVKRLGEAHSPDDRPEAISLRAVLQEIADRLDAQACVLWEPSLDFGFVPARSSGLLYAIDSTLSEHVYLEHSAVPAHPNFDFSARFLRGDEPSPWHNDFFNFDSKSASKPLMEKLLLRKVCAAKLEFGSLADRPGQAGQRGRQGLISIYRTKEGKDFNNEEAEQLAQLASFIPPLYRILNDRNILNLFREVRKALHNAGTTPYADMAEPGLGAVCEPIRNTFRCREVSIFLRDPTGPADHFRLQGTTYPAERVECKSYTGKKTEGLTGWVLHERKPVLIPDLTRFKEQKAEIDKLYPGIEWNDSGGVYKHAHELLKLAPKTPLPPVSFMACPIQSNTDLFGCIRCAIGTEPYYFSWRELSILENIAAFIAEAWAQEVEKEIWHSLLGSVVKQSQACLKQIADEDYDRAAVYRSAAASIDRGRFRGCQIVSFRMLDSHQPSNVQLLALEAAPSVYSASDIAAFLSQPKTFTAEKGRSSIPSQLLHGDAVPSQTFDLNEDGDLEEREFFRAARYVLSTPVMIAQRRHGVFDLAFSKKGDLQAALPQLRSFAEMFARNLALHEVRAEQHNTLKDLLATQTETYANVSHQLRSPLGTAVKRTQMLVERLRSGDAARGYVVEQELPIILGQCRKAFRVSSFLDIFAKISRGQKIVPQIQPLRLGLLWKAVIESLLDQRYSVGRHSRVDFDASQLDGFRQKHEDVQLLIDQSLSEQVIDAVVGNAFKYSRRGELVRVHGELEEDQLVLSIISRGVRLTNEGARLCTRKFWRGEEAQDVDADGSGLGLYLTSLIMEAQNGSLTPIPTTPEGDTCMALRFPILITRSRS